MSTIEERIENIKNCAQERSQLQLRCLSEIDLENIKSKTHIAKARYQFELCEKQNLNDYPCLVKRETIKYAI
jgi:hypothetical protein